MTTIFRTSFADNIKRISSNRGPSRQSEAPGGERFRQILADIEKKPHASSNLQAKQTDARASLAVPPQPTLPLSNLTLREQEALKQPQSLIAKAAPQAIKPVGVPPETVKAPAQSVKTPAPVSGIPNTPELLSVKPLKTTASYQPMKLKQDELEDIIKTAGRFHGLDPALGLAVAQAESSFKTTAVSKDGHNSKGLFQLLDSTARDMLSRFKVEEDYDAFDPAMNSFLGTGYLRNLHDVFSKETILTNKLKSHPARSAPDLEKLAVAAFNAGQGSVARAQEKASQLGSDPGSYFAVRGFLPSQTRDYVDRVVNMRLAHAGAETGKGIA